MTTISCQNHCHFYHQRGWWNGKKINLFPWIPDFGRTFGTWCQQSLSRQRPKGTTVILTQAQKLLNPGLRAVTLTQSYNNSGDWRCSRKRCGFLTSRTKYSNILANSWLRGHLWDLRRMQKSLQWPGCQPQLINPIPEKVSSATCTRSRSFILLRT